MKKVLTAAAVTAFGIYSAAQAQPMPPPDPWGDVTVTKAEAEAKAGERFDAADADHDGVFSETEMSAVMPGRAGNGGGRGGNGGGMMRRADANGDGKIDKAEFVASQLSRFDREDADHDGKLTKDERETARAQIMLRMQGGGGWGGGRPGGE
jgi:hypothetical protein